MAAAQLPQDEAAIKAKVETVLAGLRANDLKKAMAAPEELGGQDKFRDYLSSLLPPKGATIKTTDHSYSRWKVEKDELRVRIQFVYVWNDPKGKEAYREPIAWTSRFLKIDKGWQWLSWSLAVEDVAFEVVFASSPEAMLRIIRDNADLPPRSFARKLTESVEISVGGGELREAKAFQEGMVVFAQVSKDATAAAYADYARGLILSASNQPVDATAAYEKALTQFQKLSDVFGELDVRIHLTESLYALGKFEQALKNAEAAIAKARETKKQDRLMEALYSRGMAFRMLGLFADAAKDFRNALEIARDLKDLDGQSLSLLAIGEVERNRGNLIEAIEVLEAARKIAKAAFPPNLLTQAHVQAQLSMVALDSARYEEALEGFRKALEVFRGTGDKVTILEMMNQIGVVFLERGAADEAIKQFRANFEEAKKLGHEPGMMVALSNIGVAEHQRGKFGDAFTALSDTLARAEKAKDLHHQAKAHVNLGNFYVDTAELDLAAYHFRFGRRSPSRSETE